MSSGRFPWMLAVWAIQFRSLWMLPGRIRENHANNEFARVFLDCCVEHLDCCLWMVSWVVVCCHATWAFKLVLALTIELTLWCVMILPGSQRSIHVKNDQVFKRFGLDNGMIIRVGHASAFSFWMGHINNKFARVFWFASLSIEKVAVWLDHG